MYPRPVCRRPHPYLNAGPPTWSPALETGRSPAELLSNWRSTKRRVKRAEKNRSGNTHTKLRKPEKCCTPSKAVVAGQPGRGSGQIRPIDLGHLEAGIPQPHSCRSALCNVDQFEGMTASWRGTCLDVWGPAVGHKGVLMWRQNRGHRPLSGGKHLSASSCLRGGDSLTVTGRFSCHLEPNSERRISTSGIFITPLRSTWLLVRWSIL